MEPQSAVAVSSTHTLPLSGLGSSTSHSAADLTARFNRSRRDHFAAREGLQELMLQQERLLKQMQLITGDFLGILASRDVRRNTTQRTSARHSTAGFQEPLTKRECQVLELLVAGYSSKQIANKLGVSFKTATTHRASILAKFGVHETASLVRIAVVDGHVRGDGEFQNVARQN